MKTTLLGIIAFLTLTSFASPKNKEVEKCGKQATALELNGQFTDWNLSLKFDKGSGFYYGMTNDGQNIYLEVKMTNPMLIRKAIGLGFIVWIDPKGKGKDVLGINYPQTRMNDHTRRSHKKVSDNQDHRQLSAAEVKKRRQEMIEKFNLRYLTGRELGKLINFDKEGMSNAFFGDGDINAIVQMNEKGEIVYEAIIPLKSVFKSITPYLSKEKPFSLIIETGTFQPKTTASSMARNMGAGENSREMSGGSFGEGGQMGQGIGGMGGRMRRPGYGGAYQAMIQPTRLKLKRVVLFQAKN